MSAQPATFSWGWTAKPTNDHAPAAAVSPFAGPKTMRKTIPWRPDEMVLVDGVPMRYDLGEDDHIMVCMPGGAKVSMEHLRMRGHRVTAPKIKRIREYL